MKTYTVLWTYLANYSEHPIRLEASSAKEAAELATRWYSDDFHKRATVYVFDCSPVYVKSAE